MSDCESWSAPTPSSTDSSPRRSLLVDHAEQSPLARHAFQPIGTPVREAQARAGHQILHRARDQHLSRVGEARDPRADVYSNPAEAVAHQLALTRVKPGPDLQAQLPHGVHSRARTADGPGRPVEGREEAIP